MDELRECPFCGEPAQLKDSPNPHRHGRVGCPKCGIYKQWSFSPKEAIQRWNTRTQIEVEPPFYDIVEMHEGCTVQVLKNSITGDVSVGWWK